VTILREQKKIRLIRLSGGPVRDEKSFPWRLSEADKKQDFDSGSKNYALWKISEIF
jgi:hypothetical protein